MSKLKHDWNSSNIIDDVDYHEEDAAAFKKLFSTQTKKDSGNPLASLGSGYVLKGRIVEITKDFVVIDVGLKSEGLVPMSEFSDTSEIFLDNVVEVFLEQTEGEDGQIVLSRDKAHRLRQWENIVDNCTEGSIVTGKVLRKVKGGLMVDIGVEAFLPGSQIDNKRIKNLDEYINHIYDFKILKINTDRKNIVISRRELLEEERISKKVEMLENFQEGEIRHGTVKNITDFGVFLDINGVDGLLHITDMTWKRIKHPSEMGIEVGDELEVLILQVDLEKGRVALGMKQKETNPWEEIKDRFRVGTCVTGVISSLVPYGAFLELETDIPNLERVEGLIHLSEMSWTKTINDPIEMVKKGDIVKAVVLSVQKEEGKIFLGMKQLEKNPWDDIDEKYPINSSVSAEIRNLTSYGAFVELEPGIDGLIHISDLSWIKKVSHPSEFFKKGDKVDAIILSVDKSNKKITLGVKQLTENPWKDIEDIMSIGSLASGIVSKTSGFGAFVEIQKIMPAGSDNFIELERQLEGLIHVTEISDQPFGKIEEVISKGKEIVAKVIKIDSEHKRISLSLKEYLIEQNKENHDDIVVGEKKKKTTKKKTKEKATDEEIS